MSRRFELVSKEEYEKSIADFYEAQYNIKCFPMHKFLDYNDLVLPERQTKYAAGYDFITPVDIELNPHESIKIPTGVKVKMESDKVLMIYPRSGFGFEFFLRMANTTCIIDADYYNNPKNEGHIMMKLRNESDRMFRVVKGTRIAQGIFMKYYLVDGDNPEDKETRAGGLGSTN